MFNSAGQDQHWDYSPTRSEYGSTGSDSEPEPVPLPVSPRHEEEQPEQEDILPVRRSNSSCTSPTAFSAGRPPAQAALPRPPGTREEEPAPARSPSQSTRTPSGSVSSPSVGPDRRSCTCAAEPLTRAPLPSTGNCAHTRIGLSFSPLRLTLSKGLQSHTIDPHNCNVSKHDHLSPTFRHASRV